MRIKLGYPLRIQDITKYCNGRTRSKENTEIYYISTDSRELEKGDLFFCLKGKRYNGEDYIDKAKEIGAYVVSEQDAEEGIQVVSTEESLLSLAGCYIDNLKSLRYKIGITGSVGKTTTKDFLALLLSERHKVHKTEGNLNNEIGMPLTLLSAPVDTEILCVEMGMNHRGEIMRMSECLRPNLGIITNIGTSHIGNLGSREGIAMAKLEILSGIEGGTLLIPFDEPLLENKRESKTFSRLSKEADFYLKELSNEEIEIYHKGRSLFSASFPILGFNFRECLIASVSGALLCGYKPEELKKRIPLITRDNIRQKFIRRGNYCFYTDFYNSSIESLRASYDTMRQIEADGEKSAIIGDIGELGEYETDIHVRLGKEIPKDIFSHIFLFGKMAETIKLGALEAGFPAEKIHINSDFTHPEVTAKQVKENRPMGETILIKGSRVMRMERILEFF